MAKQSTQSRKRRRKKYKIHYDRLLAQLIMLGLFIFLMVWIVRKCFFSDSVEHGNRDKVFEAVEAGRRDAEKVLHTAPLSMERDEALLFIRAREHQLRSHGYGHAADDYIEAAKQYLDEHGIR